MRVLSLSVPAAAVVAAFLAGAGGVIHGLSHALAGLWAQAAGPELSLLPKLLDLGGWAVMAGALLWLLTDQTRRGIAIVERMSLQFLGELQRERESRERSIALLADRLDDMARLYGGGGREKG